MNRIDALKESGTALCSYRYLGSGVVVGVKYDAASNIELTCEDGGTGDAGDPYTGLDRFGRLVETLWKKGGTDQVRSKYGRNRFGGVVWRRDVKAHAQSPAVDTEDNFYWYDALQQVSERQRGDLTGTAPDYTGISNLQQDEAWTYDATGNWQASSNTAPTSAQARINNTANEITLLSSAAGDITPAYDPARNMTTLPQAPGTATAQYDLKWDAWNRLVEVMGTRDRLIIRSRRNLRSTNDDHFHLTRVVAASETVTTTYGYTHGYQTSTDYGDTIPDVTSTYDALGRVSTVTQSGQSQIAYAYNPSNLSLASETVSYDLDPAPGYEFARTLHRHSDALLRPMSLEVTDGANPAQYTAGYRYDTAGRLDGVWRSPALPASKVPAGNPDFVYAYTPDSPGLIATVTGPAHVATNTWEPNRDVLDTKVNTKIDTTPLSSIDYTVNALGQRTHATRTGAATYPTTWGYDGLGQVISAANTGNPAYDRAYQYDTIGNRTEAQDGTTTLTGTPNNASNPLNQYTTVPGTGNTPQYDADGNATAYPLPVAPAQNATLAWNGESSGARKPAAGSPQGRSGCCEQNQLISTTAGGPVTTYRYDALGRRITKTTGATKTIYLYDGWNCIAEYDSSLNLQTSNTWGLDLSGKMSGKMQGAGGVGGLLAVTFHAGSPVTYYPLYDGNGNITEYIDNQNGGIATHYEYDPFGRIANAGAPNQASFRYRFSTKPQDDETGLYYYGYRHYDPLTGRWPSRDPIEEDGGVNLYAFVGNCGVNTVDYLGLDPPGKGINNIECCDKKHFDSALYCCVNDKLISTSETETIQVCVRPAQIKGGEAASGVGILHHWIKTSTTESGMGQVGGGVPGEDGMNPRSLPMTQMNDHTGQSKKPGARCFSVMVNKCCIEKNIKVGTPTGKWCPPLNDCNSIVKEAIESCASADVWKKVFQQIHGIGSPADTGTAILRAAQGGYPIFGR